MNPYEIDFIPVGTGEKGGDAAALRVWDDTGTQKVFVIDGGTKESGKVLVNHIKTFYGTSVVEAVISTHPDGDHSSGLTEILEKLEVKYLFMHKPWEHADNIKHLFENPSLTSTGIVRKIREELEFAYELKKIADRKGIPIIEPFSGWIYFGGLMHVIGPSIEHYRAMLPHFRSTPDAVEPIIGLGRLFNSAAQSIERAVEWVAESMMIETLTDEGGHFSAENSSSAIILFTIGTAKILFTGDADIAALSQAVAYASGHGISLIDLQLLDVPHHGSQHNVGPTILNIIKAKYSHISAPADSPKHPSKKVINALIRRGSQVYSTCGKTICYPGEGVASRSGWVAALLLPFNHQVENT